MLFECVSSYVSKMKDHSIIHEEDRLGTSGYQIGNKYMVHLDVSYPEMIHQLSGIRCSQYKGIMKKYRIPHISKVTTEKMVVQYINRTARKSGVCLLEFLRTHRTDSGHAKLYVWWP